MPPQSQQFLEILANNASFARSDLYPTGMNRFMQHHANPYYYHWRKDGGMDVLIFEDPIDVNTAKMFRYSKDQIIGGSIHLIKDNPDVVGKEIIRVLQEYSNSYSGFYYQIN